MNKDIALLLSCLLCLYLGWKIYHLKMRSSLAEEKLKEWKEGREELHCAFKALSYEALEKNSRIFLDLAQTNLEKFQEGAKSDLEKRHSSIQELVKPLQEKLMQFDQGLRSIELERKEDHTFLKVQLDHLFESERKLVQETASLTKALRSPQTRGRWGELQLQRVVELCGMLNHCDFMQQITSEEGVARPDLIIKLPGGRQIIVDAKAPMEAYLDAIESSDEERYRHKLKEHARLVRTHACSLGKKSYYQYFQPTPEFVILFLPSEHFFSLALQQDPTLIELGIEQGVILATPTTLIALLRTVAYGWKQESLTKHVQQVSQLGQEFYKRLGDMTNHFAKTGRALSSAVEAYNQTIRSLETRVLVSARKFHEMGVSSKELEICSLDPIEKISVEPAEENIQM